MYVAGCVYQMYVLASVLCFYGDCPEPSFGLHSSTHLYTEEDKPRLWFWPFVSQEAPKSTSDIFLFCYPLLFYFTLLGRISHWFWNSLTC